MYILQGSWAHLDSKQRKLMHKGYIHISEGHRVCSGKFICWNWGIGWEGKQKRRAYILTHIINASFVQAGRVFKPHNLFWPTTMGAIIFLLSTEQFKIFTVWVITWVGLSWWRVVSRWLSSQASHDSALLTQLNFATQAKLSRVVATLIKILCTHIYSLSAWSAYQILPQNSHYLSFSPHQPFIILPCTYTIYCHQHIPACTQSS
jgi:hypothetical protein